MKTILRAAVALACALPIAMPRAAFAVKTCAHCDASTRVMKTTGSISASAATDETVYSPGQPLRVSITARNAGKRAKTLNFPTSRRFDFSIFRDGESEPIYRWSAGRMFTQVLGSETLAPNETRTFEAGVGDATEQLAPGNYRLEAHLTSSEGSIAASPIHFSVRDLHLEMTAKTDRTRYVIGEPIRIEMQVKNLLDKSNTIRFSSGQTYDVFVTRENAPVWSDSANKRYAQALRNVVWKAGETQTFSAQWNTKGLPIGRYRIQAILSSSPKVYAPTVDIFIVDKL